MKNLSEHEQCIFNLSLHFCNIEKLKDIGTYVPKEISVLGRLTNFLHGVHVDYDNDIPHIYDIANCSIMELRGGSFLKNICDRHLHDILMDMREDVTDGDSPDTLLKHLYSCYDKEMDDHPKSKYK